MKKKLGILLLMLGALFSTQAAVSIYTIGDSTMADYDPSTYPDQRGWGQMFKQFFTGDITVNNAARNGRSSKSFYNEGLWATVLSKAVAGDYIFIQFGHNDEKDNGASGEVGTTPAEYAEYLGKYITEARAKGAIPVLLTPVVRCYFSGETITAKGAHDLSTGDTELNYPKAMRSVATEMNVPLIDHTVLTKQLAEEYGSAQAKSIIYVQTDNTHLSVTGAMLYARLVVQDMQTKGILTSYLNTSPDLIVNPSSLDFGNCYVSTSANRTFTLAGMDLNPAEGNITITATDGFTVAAPANPEFASTLQIPYTSGNLASTSITVRFAPNEAKTYNGTISVQVGSGTPKTIALTGTALSMEGGVEATVHFPLMANGNAEVTGPITSLGQSLSGLYIKNYATITNWPEGAVSTDKAQRIIITGDAWPGNEEDIVTSRYVQFAVQPQEGTTLTVNNINFFAGAAGGGALGYRVMMSLTEDFAEAVTLLDKPQNSNNTMEKFSFTPVVSVDEGQTFYLRFYPWYRLVSSNKYLCLQHLSIEGLVSNKVVTGIGEQAAEEVFTAYPNPTSGTLYLANAPAGAEVAVYTQAGTLVYRKKLASNAEALDLSALSKGVYLLNVVAGETKEVKKIVIR